MRRQIRRLLWRYGCGLVSEDRLTEALDHHCRHLFDQRFEHPAVKSQPLSASSDVLTRLDEFESTLALTRSHTRAQQFRRAYQTLGRAEFALQHALEVLEASAELAAVSDTWHQEVAELDLVPLKNFASFRVVESIFRAGKRCLAAGEAAKAKVVVVLAKHRVSDLLGSREDEERRARLKQRLSRLRGEMEVPVAKGLERILAQHLLELGSHLLDDWETANPISPEAHIDSKTSALFEELLHRSQNLSAQLNRLSKGEN